MYICIMIYHVLVEISYFSLGAALWYLGNEEKKIRYKVISIVFFIFFLISLLT